MRILLYADDAAPGSGAWCYAATLREMGHDVLLSSDRDSLSQYRTKPLSRILRKVLHGPLEAHRRRHAAELVSKVGLARPAIIIVLKGLAISIDDVKAMRALGAWVVNVNHDDFFSLNRNNWSPVQRAAIGAYDFVFTTREINVSEVARLNPRVEFFPFAYYPRIHRPVEIPDDERATWGMDVVFVGTWERERCRLLEHLVQSVPAQYAIWGAQWERVGRRSPLRPFVKHREVILDEMAKAIHGSKVALAFLRKENRDDYTQRSFEIPACGGVLLGERTARHRSLYREGVEAEFFDAANPDELAAKLRALLAEPARREALRAAGLAAISRQRQTYRDRLERLLAVHRSQTGGRPV